MKYLILILIFPFFLQAQKIKYEYNFSPENLKIEQAKGFSIINYPNCIVKGEIGGPSLPFYPIKLILPQSFTAKKVNIYFENKHEFENLLKIYPQQPVKPISSVDRDTFIIKKVENKIGPVFDSFAIAQMNGVTFLISNFSPFEYDPKNQKLSLYQKVTLEIELCEQKNYEYKNFWPKQPILRRIEKFAQNPEELKNYSRPDKNTTENYEVLIISKSDYLMPLKNLKDYYRKIGLRSKIITTEQIQIQYSGVDLSEKIRNCIIAEYQNYGIEYITLAGDAEIVPYRGLHCTVQSSSVYTDNNIPADIYFSGIDGNWNSDNDNLWGEVGEEDLLPDLSVGRLPFSNTTELLNIINKLNKYTFTPITQNNKLRKVLLIGEHLWNNPETWGSQYLNLLIGTHNENGYTTTGIPPSHLITTLYEEQTPLNTNVILSNINQGHNFIYHVGHSNITTMMFLNLDDITNENFNQIDGLNNNFAPLYSHGCYCGAFDNNDCISEKMVTIEKFAIGVFTNSRYGWFNEGQTEGPSQHLNREFVDALYNDKENAAGTAQLISKAETAPWIYQQNEWEPGAQRWVFYCHNSLIDPAVPLWTDNKNEIYLTYSISPDKQKILIFVQDINFTPLKNIRVALSINDIIYEINYTDNNGICELNMPENYDENSYILLTLVGYNFIEKINIIQTDTNEPNHHIKIFPNPTPSKFFIKSGEELKEVNIYNTAGKKIKVEFNDEIDISNLTKGVYLLEIKTSNKYFMGKIVKE